MEDNMKCKKLEVIEVNIFEDTQAPHYKSNLNKAINIKLEQNPNKELVKLIIKEENAYLLLGGE